MVIFGIETLSPHTNMVHYFRCFIPNKLEFYSYLLFALIFQAYNLQNGPSETCDQVEDKDRSYLARFFPASAESYDMLELETGL